MRVDLHNHTKLCNHCEGEMEEFIKEAIDKKIDVFGFSDHAPMLGYDKKYRMEKNQINFYENSVQNLKEKYKNKIDILLGYEVDFLNNYIDDDILNGDIDYLIGSVHFLDNWGFDNPEFIREYKNKDIDIIWEEYFYQIEQMAKSGKFDIIGHLDLIKVFKFLPKKNINLIAKDSMKAIKDNNLVLEINSAGFRKPIKEQYPSIDLLKMAFDMNIDITFGSDAHKIEQIGFKYDEITNLAKKIGFRKSAYFRDRDKILVDF